MSRICLLRVRDNDGSGETMQSTLPRRDSELGFYPRRAAFEREVFKTLAPEESQFRVNFTSNGQGRVIRCTSKNSRKSLSLFTWEVQIEQLDGQQPNGIEDRSKVEFAVIEISESV